MFIFLLFAFSTFSSPRTKVFVEIDNRKCLSSTCFHNTSRAAEFIAEKMRHGWKADFDIHKIDSKYKLCVCVGGGEAVCLLANDIYNAYVSCFSRRKISNTQSAVQTCLHRGVLCLCVGHHHPAGGCHVSQTNPRRHLVPRRILRKYTTWQRHIETHSTS